MDDPLSFAALLSTVAALGILFVLAFIVETLVEFLFGWLFDKLPALTPYKQALRYIAVLIGVVGTFLYNLDLLHISSQIIAAIAPEGAQPVPLILPITWYGKAVTGIAIGMGSSYFHQFVSKFFPAKK